MKLRQHLVIVAILLSPRFYASTANAWNSPGHRIIALIAYDQLDPAVRAKAVELLRSHPRFGQHFHSEMPREIARGDRGKQDEWIFAHAATWPDQVRSAKGGVDHQDVSQFNRPWWHFVNEPIFLNEDERQKLQGEIRANRRRDPPQENDEPNMNVIQAIKNSTRILRDNSVPVEKRAVHLCWLLHLTGDAHQPLHSAALYTTHRFRDGDHGGNYVEYEHQWDLHGFWDEQISTDEPFQTARILATDLDMNAALKTAGETAATSLNPGQWIDESFAIAKQHAYTPEVLEKVADREGHSRLGPLDLSPQYKIDAANIAERRAVEAGYRLAKTIEQLLQ